jgi:hypothetical protein
MINAFIPMLLPLCLGLILSHAPAAKAAEEPQIPSFRDVSVHDPSIIRADDGTYTSTAATWQPPRALT